MIVSINGSTGTPLCQIDRVRDGFRDLGHEHTDNWSHPDTAFVFVGNAPFDAYLAAAQANEKKLIFNVLDLCPHCVEHDQIVARMKETLPIAHRVTAISKTVAAEVEAKCGVKAEVIYYPMKPVRFTGGKRYPQFKVALVGRVLDSNKRSRAAVSALLYAGYEEHEVAIVGPERLSWGTNLGVVSDEVLNDVYNSVDYVMALSKNEGICLPPIEGACCGAIPIVAPSLSTFEEFWADSPLGINYRALTSVNEVGNLLIALDKDTKWKADVKESMLGYAELAFRPKFTPSAVAAKILGVYQSI